MPHPHPHPHTNSPCALRYSPRPLATYLAHGSTFSYGPATSAMLTTPEAWNLAYLSHNFDAQLQHPDPHFTVNVLRTVQFRLDGSGSDITSQSYEGMFGSLLTQPAPRVVYLLRQHPSLNTLPMYLAYGEAWLRVMEERERRCRAEEDVAPEPALQPEQLRQARDLLRRMAQR